MSTTVLTGLHVQILADTAAAGGGRHVDEVEDDSVVLPAAHCTLPTTPSYTCVLVHFWQHSQKIWWLSCNFCCRTVHKSAVSEQE